MCTNEVSMSSVIAILKSEEGASWACARLTQQARIPTCYTFNTNHLLPWYPEKRKGHFACLDFKHGTTFDLWAESQRHYSLSANEDMQITFLRPLMARAWQPF
jgi:hypothetical protein